MSRRPRRATHSPSTRTMGRRKIQRRQRKLQRKKSAARRGNLQSPGWIFGRRGSRNATPTRRAMTAHNTASRKMQEKPRRPGPRTLPPFSLLEEQFRTLTFHQGLQFIEQVLVLSADRLHKIGKMKRSVFRSQELPDTVHRSHPLQFFRAAPHRVAEGLSFKDAVEKSFSKQTVHRRQDSGIGLPDFAILQHFTNRGSSSRPH